MKSILVFSNGEKIGDGIIKLPLLNELKSWQGVKLFASISIVLSTAAYNAGPNRVNRWIKINGNPSNSKYDAIDWIEKIPFKETRNYVQRIIENYVVYQKVIEDRNRIENRNIIEIIEGNATNE